MNIIFLAGVHGVGKGYLGTLVAALLDVEHCTASQLIRDEKGQATWSADKLVTNIDDNQIALVNAINRRRHIGRPILLDGHFVLRDSAGNLVHLEGNVFSSLGLCGVILLCDDAGIIAARLAGRDGIQTSPESIIELAAKEAAHACFVCRALNIPLTVLESPTKETLKDAVARLLV